MNKFRLPGMRRVRLLLWQLYYRTPLSIDIDEGIERKVAGHCKLGWEDYLKLKTEHPELWQRAVEKRGKAKLAGSFPPQPWQLQVYRKLHAKRKKLLSKERPRFFEWAGKKLIASRKYKRQWLRKKVLNRVEARLLGND